MASANHKHDIVPPKNIKTLPLVNCSLFYILSTIVLRTLAVALIYASGYWKINPLWFFIAWGFVKYRDRKRLEHRFKREAAKAVSTRDDRLLVLSNVDPLPSWVYFTDTERCEWLNKAINHIWPTIRLNKPVLDLLKKLEPDITKVMLEYKNKIDFRFDDVVLGSLPPRITGIRVYGNNSNVYRRALDVHIVYMSDCAFKCSLKRKVHIGGNSFQLAGCLRAIISSPEPSSSPRLKVFFVKRPRVDFQLNMGNYSNVGSMVRTAINVVVKKRFVLPNMCVINYDKRVGAHEREFPNPEGLLSVDVIEARDLEGTKPLFYSSKTNPDPYATITFGAKTFATPVETNTMDPVWNFSAVFVVDCFFDDVVHIEVEDQNHRRKLGNLTLALKQMEVRNTFRSWMQLEGVVGGMLHLCVSYLKLDFNPGKEVLTNLPAVLEVFIDDAEEFSNSKGNITAEVSVGSTSQLSKSLTVNQPVFSEAFSFPVKGPKADRVRINLKNKKDGKSVSNAEIDIKQMFGAKNMEVINKNTNINIKDRNETSRVKLLMRVRTIKP